MQSLGKVRTLLSLSELSSLSGCVSVNTSVPYSTLLFWLKTWALYLVFSSFIIMTMSVKMSTIIQKAVILLSCVCVLYSALFMFYLPAVTVYPCSSCKLQKVVASALCKVQTVLGKSRSINNGLRRSKRKREKKSNVKYIKTCSVFGL